MCDERICKIEDENCKTEFVDELDEPIYVSIYARVFDADSKWPYITDHDKTLLWIRSQQNYANELLQRDKRLLLNKVYTMLGLSETKAGKYVGWRYIENNPTGDNYVDFGIYSDYNRDYINGHGLDKLILDFNVDGVI